MCRKQKTSTVYTSFAWYIQRESILFFETYSPTNLSLCKQYWNSRRRTCLIYLSKNKHWQDKFLPRFFHYNDDKTSINKHQYKSGLFSFLGGLIIWHAANITRRILFHILLKWSLTRDYAFSYNIFLYLHDI